LFQIVGLFPSPCTRTLKILGIETNTTQLSHVVSSSTELELQPGAEESFKVLKDAGCSIIALTGASENSTIKWKALKTVQFYLKTSTFLLASIIENIFDISIVE
jgi:hypothetical protein